MKKIYVLLVCFFWGAGLLQAQEAESSFIKDTDPYNYYQIQKKAEKFFKEEAREKKKAARQAGTVPTEERTYTDDAYIKYKRWEWYWRDRILPDGSFPDLNKQVELYQQVQRRAAAGRTTAVTPSWKNINFTQNTGGYNGMGRVVAIGFHPTDPQTFYAGGARGGIWKTTNGGQSYTPLGDGLSFLAVGNILVDHQNPQTLYISVGDRTFWHRTLALGVYKSTDGGQTWNPTSLRFSPADNVYINRMEMSPTNPAVILLSTTKGLLRTGDGGATWQYVSEGEHQDVRFHPTQPNLAFVGKVQPSSGMAQIYRSTDGGVNWKLASAFKLRNNTIRMAFTKADPAYLAVLCSLNGQRELHESSDYGQTFVYKANVPPTAIGFCMSQLNKNILYAADVEVHRSIDGGRTWKQLTKYCCPTAELAEVHADTHFMEPWPHDPAVLFQGNDGGVYSYHEPSNKWTERNNGLVITQYYDIAVAQTNPTIMTGGTQDNGSFIRRTNGNWQSTNGGDGMMQAIDYTNPNIIYTTYVNGTLYRSMDGWNADTYREISPLVNGSRLRGEWVAPYLIDPNTPTVLVAGYNDVYRSTNRGDSWTRISTNLAGGNIQNLAVAPSNSSVIYATRDNRVYRTTNLGGAWTSSAVPSGGQRITRIVVDAANADRVWVSVAGFTSGVKVFRSDNGGTSWTNVSGSLPNVVTNCMVYETGSNGRVYLGTDAGVFYRDDSISDWVLYGKGLPNTSVFDLEIQYATRALRAGTHGRGIFEIALVENTGCGAVANLAAVDVTHQNARISWTGVANVGRYSVAIRTEGTADWTVVADSVAATSYTVTGLLASTRYQVQVSSVCLDGTETAVSAFETQPVPAPCSIAPNARVTTLTNTSATLRWDAVAGAVKYTLSLRQTDTAEWTLVSDSLGGTSYTFSELPRHTDFVASLTAVCAQGQKKDVSIPFKTLNVNCVAPPKVTQVALTANTLAIKWDNQPDALTYAVWIQPGGGAWRQVATGLSFMTTSYIVTDLLPATAYTAEVRVSCTNSEVQASQLAFTTRTVKTTCGRPENLAAIGVSFNSAKLIWTGSTAVKYYTVSVQSETDWQLQDLYIDGRTDAYSLTGLKPDTKYLVKLEAVCQTGTRISSSIVLRTGLAPATCEAPLVLGYDGITHNAATINWVKLPRDDNYYIWLLPEGGSWTLVTSNYKANSYTFTNLVAGKKYTVDLYVNCTAGGNLVTRTTFTTLATPPVCAGPAGLQVTNVTETAATIQLAAPAPGETYQVYYSRADVRNWVKLAENSTQTSFALTGLPPGTAYLVKAWKACSDGSYKASQTSFTTLELCRAPGSLTANPVTATTAMLNWTGSPASEYFYIWLLDGGWKLVVNYLPPTATDYQLTGLKANTEYTADVWTYCTEGGYKSSRITFRTGSGLTAPDNLVVTDQTPTSVTLAWNTVPEASTYSIWYRKAESEPTDAWTMGATGLLTTSYTLDGLVPLQTYTVQVRAEKEAEYLESSIPVTTLASSALPLSEGVFGQGNTATGAFVLFPMPASTEVKIQLETLYSGTLPVTLYTLSGQQLQVAIRTFAEGKATLPLPAELPSGMYLLQVGSQNKKLEVKR